ncbi:MAG: cell wall-active antibiotics response protein [Nannocystaceae bacterium]|nr:cell wall-active antibiotics response protein [Nannocystaceae bacterium]
MNPPSPNLPARVINQEVSALFAETKRAGPWTPGATTLVKATFAEINLDLRDAILPDAPELCLDVEVLVGSITITIPPTWAVIQEVDLLVGSYEEDSEPADASVETPQLLRITGRIRVGSVEVRRRLPGEGWLGAKRRRWQLRSRARKRKALREPHK